MRNLAFTCDFCGHQFDRCDGGATLSFSPVNSDDYGCNDYNHKYIKKFEYDFCEKCAESIGVQIKEFLSQIGAKV